MDFRKYQHVEKLGNLETEGLLDGVCHIFYKIDGTNASLWLGDDGQMKGGSRNRELTLENDNQGFYNWAIEQNNIVDMLIANPDLTLYGEWLVPHSLKTYREDAWRDFYVFDVVDEEGSYLPYDVYSNTLNHWGIRYIPPLATIKNPSIEQLNRFLEKSGEFLVKDGEGKGEGIVIKNYDYTNRFGRQTWGKIVTNEFKEKHHKEMGAPLVNNTISIEEKIVEKFLTDAYVSKEYEKIVNEHQGWHNKFLPRLFGVVFHEFIRDEMHAILKEHKKPTINFKWLFQLVVRKCKELVNP
jgi:hypothetical protein